jgi:hypothetical protein
LPAAEKSLYLTVLEEIIIAMAPLKNHNMKADRTDNGDYNTDYLQNVQQKIHFLYCNSRARMLELNIDIYGVLQINRKTSPK